MKPFDKTLHARHDYAAKNAVMEWLEFDGWNVYENPDKYGVDLIADKDGRELFIEVEIKRAWATKFPFRSIHIPKRKEKFIKPNTIFMVLNDSLTQAYAIHAEALNMCITIEKNTSLTREPDQFFEIPLKFAFLYDIENPSREGES